MSKKRQRTRPAAATSKSFEFNPNYSLVKRDLARIGILAGTFLAILVGLSFFQDQLLALFVK
ncbi:MAG: hypothetical protein JXB85_04830 [Anaerolineales bacterium]|nr:hypothetical protein [Anaerolineales bacterium]